MNSPGLCDVLLYQSMCSVLNIMCFVSIIAGAITNLRVVGYNKSRVNLSWKNPETDYQIPAYSYTVTVESLGISDRTQAFLPEVDPSFSIDLRGHECETVQIEVGLFGDEQEPQLVNATLLARE